MKNRYGVVYDFEKVGPDTYKIVGNLEYWRFGGKENQPDVDMADLGFVDPSGGPFISLGYTIKGREVKRISLIDGDIIFTVE